MKETLERALVSLTGNRISFLGYGLIGYGIFNSSDALKAGFIVLAMTLGGNFTGQLYSRTERDIKEKGRLDERFANAVFHQHYYCGRQGLYLAAKKHGQLDVYRKVQKKFRVVIPNF